MKQYNNRRAFTLAELLIVVAIIGVLVAISIPIFNSQLEKSRQAVDLSNMRTAYGAAEYAFLTEGKAVLGIFDAKSGQLVSGTIPEGYGKSRKNVSEWLENSGPVNRENASGKPNVDGKEHVLMVETDDNGRVSMYWTSVSYNPVYVDTVKPYKNETLTTLKGMNNTERSKADKETLFDIGKMVLSQGWTRKQLEDIMGIEFSGPINNQAVRIADYYQLKEGSFEDDNYWSNGFKITSKNEILLNMLEDMGFDGGNISDKSSSNGRINTTYSNSLFYSDELATNNFNNNAINRTKRSIILEGIKTDSNGKITQFTIYSKAMDNNANMSEEEKAKFRVTVKLSDLEN